MSLKSDKNELNQYFNLLLKIGLMMILSILAFFSLGLFLEKKFKTNGILLILCTLIGIGIGFYGIYREVMSLK